MINNWSMFTKIAEFNGLFLDDQQVNKFKMYYKMLLEWNEKINLTTITSQEEVMLKHFIDSLMVLKFVNIEKSHKLIDIGTGAGFPGVPIKIYRQEIELTLLDSLQKRLVFLGELLNKLNLSATVVHARAESAAQTQVYREAYDFAVSRAVAPLNVLVEYCLPFVKPGGIFIAMKSQKVNQEINISKLAIKSIGGEIIDVQTFQLPDASERAMVKIKKTYKTPQKYPRHNSQISQKPL